MHQLLCRCSFKTPPSCFPLSLLFLSWSRPPSLISLALFAAGLRAISLLGRIPAPATMADMQRSGVFAKNVQKRLSRAQEKVLQKLGKADETKDEQFEEYVLNFKRQEAEGSRLQKELRGYLAAIKGMQEASKKLTESLHEVYEPDWYGREDVKVVGEKCDVLWEDFHQKLVDGSLLTLDTYLGQFPDIKNRIAKRSRKLVDYDSARHHLEALQSSKRKDEGRISKAEEEFQKAQKVFEDFNIDLQEELPSLWSRRVGFYVNTFKNISSLEAKFHKEISLLCHKLYEVMSKLGEQHADKAFTILGAPSDSGPLRIANTPSPPEEESPLHSPEASPNHTLAAPPSPAPARPKSPSQLRKGPPVPPLPKLTPTKELQQENIISLFDDNFVPEINVTTPSQNEVPEAKKEESLLDLDFDPFKPDAAATVVTHSPMSQTLPWDLWTTSNELVQPASSSAFNGFTQDTSLFSMQASQNVMDNLAETEEETPPSQPQAEEAPSAPEVAASEPEAEAQPAEAAEPAADAVAAVEEGTKESPELAEKECELQMDSVIQGPAGTEGVAAAPGTEAGDVAALAEGGVGENDIAGTEGKAGESQENLSSIPSVVIEPASNNEADGEDHEVLVNESKDAVEDVGGAQGTEGPAGETSEAASEHQTTQSTSSEEQPVSADDSMPPGFRFKVETLHDFEAANSDELNLLRGDIVLVIQSAAEADQEAGWLTGIKESDWLQYKDVATYKGLFPENFTRCLE
ncbi:amphiphysin isoform X2 [Lacerta agilis]|uniref:amphiphysin isoform X2 n=1 Tax=Lacerta agilis TaxID=80427 RepID=UPI00141A33AA|nr:amphiphysin isoform X2 [Lacerta agilis]